MSTEQAIRRLVDRVGGETPASLLQSVRRSIDRIATGSHLSTYLVDRYARVQMEELRRHHAGLEMAYEFLSAGVVVPGPARRRILDRIGEAEALLAKLPDYEFHVEPESLGEAVLVREVMSDSFDGSLPMAVTPERLSEYLRMLRITAPE